MSLIVSVYTREGIIMGSDSRTSFTSVKQVTPGESMSVLNGHYFDTVDKTFLAPNNCGISTCGDGSINGLTLAGIMKTFFRTKLNESDTVIDTANKLLEYIKSLSDDTDIIFHVFGFDTDEVGIKTSKGFRVYTSGQGNIVEYAKGDNSGAIWDGQTEIVTRLIKGFYIARREEVIEKNTTLILLNDSNKQVLIPESILINTQDLTRYYEQNIPWELMSTQDGIDFVNFSIRTTIDTMKFTTTNKTVGGPIDILIITPDGAKWINKKPSY